MANRFTDSEKWKKAWFRKLSPTYKCFWIYILDNCDFAGFWSVDFELAAFQIGSELNIDDIKQLFKHQIVVLNDGTKWFIKDYISFQYGELSEECKPHNSVIKKLKKERLWKEYTKGIHTTKDIYKDKDKDKDKDTPKCKYSFEAVWDQYPNKDGKKKAEIHFNASVKSEEDYNNIQKALINYKKHLELNSWKTPKNGSTWFNNWKDWINYDPEKDNGKNGNKRFITI